MNLQSLSVIEPVVGYPGLKSKTVVNLCIVYLGTITRPGSSDIIIHSVYYNKVYYVPDLDALWVNFVGKLTLNRPGGQCFLLLDEQVSAFFGGYTGNTYESGSIVSVIDGVNSITMPCTFTRNNILWAVKFFNKDTIENKKVVINCLLLPRKKLI